MADDQHEIMRALGRLEAGLERIREDFDAEKEHTRESRERTYDKLEKIEGNVGLVGQIAGAARTEAQDLKKLVVDDVKPVTDEVKRMRVMGMGAIAVIGFAAALLGVSFASFGEQAINWLRSLLRIG